MSTPAKMLEAVKKKIKREWKTAFVWTFIIGLLIHMPVMLSDVPNHDGLSSMYFDQNMITSGRWFLMIACGFSSFYTLPWVIGLLGLLFLGLCAAALTEVLEVKNSFGIVLMGGLLVSFPALASTFAYVFTLDGYMLALFLAVLAVLFTKKSRFGFVWGGICLAFSMGTYQAYVSMAMLLSIYCILMTAMDDGDPGEKVKRSLRYLYMGGLGAGLYYAILQILLRIQGKELDTYQGISGLEGGASSQGGLLERIASMYRDFFAFTLRGNVLFNGRISGAALLLLGAAALLTLGALALRKKWWKNPVFFVIMALSALSLPLATNAILLISPDVTYHLLMRYQWVVYLLVMTAFVSKYAESHSGNVFFQWCAVAGAAVLILHYGVTDNIGYSNLQKRYEKTYAYCIRLLDRIEQTQGYYQGIPIAMVGVVGDEQFPATDITGDVTSNMIGLNGDILLYTGENYQAFMKNYLGATLNFLPSEAMEEIYFSEEYKEMESFPGKTSTKVVDGILYVKTENMTR